MVVREVASADFPTRWGHFRIYGFVGTPGLAAPSNNDAAPTKIEEAVALVTGDVHAEAPLVRIHSQC
ncbi:hypothetical protein ACX0FC_20505, partial [Enterococcus faecium]